MSIKVNTFCCCDDAMHGTCQQMTNHQRKVDISILMIVVMRSCVLTTKEFLSCSLDRTIAYIYEIVYSKNLNCKMLCCMNDLLLKLKTVINHFVCPAAGVFFLCRGHRGRRRMMMLSL